VHIALYARLLDYKRSNQCGFNAAMAIKRWTVEAVNARLKVGRVGVQVLQVGNRLRLQATLPSKNLSEKWAAVSLYFHADESFAGLPSGRITPLAVGMPHPAMGLGLALIGYGIRMRTWRLQRRLFRHRHLRPLQRLPLD